MNIFLPFEGIGNFHAIITSNESNEFQFIHLPKSNKKGSFNKILPNKKVKL